MPKKLPVIPPFRVDIRGSQGEWRVVAVEHTFTKAEWQYTRWQKAYRTSSLRLTKIESDNYCELLVTTELVAA